VEVDKEDDENGAVPPVGIEADVAVVVDGDAGVVVVDDVEVRRPPCPAVGGETKNHDDVKPGEDDPACALDWDFARAAAAAADDDDADGRSRTIPLSADCVSLLTWRGKLGL
jgi:hypothetical protein